MDVPCKIVLRTLPHRDQFTQLMWHAQLLGVGIVTKGLDDQIQLICRAKCQIEEKGFFAADNTAPAAVAVEILLPNLIA